MSNSQPITRRLLHVKPAAQAARLVRLADAATYIACSTRKLRTLVQNGIIEVVQDDPHGPWLIDLRDLDDWIEKHKVRMG